MDPDAFHEYLQQEAACDLDCQDTGKNTCAVCDDTIGENFMSKSQGCVMKVSHKSVQINDSEWVLNC